MEGFERPEEEILIKNFLDSEQTSSESDDEHGIKQYSFTSTNTKRSERNNWSSSSEASVKDEIDFTSPKQDLTDDIQEVNIITINVIKEVEHSQNKTYESSLIEKMSSEQEDVDEENIGEPGITPQNMVIDGLALNVSNTNRGLNLINTKNGMWITQGQLRGTEVGSYLHDSEPQDFGNAEGSESEADKSDPDYNEDTDGEVPNPSMTKDASTYGTVRTACGEAEESTESQLSGYKDKAAYSLNRSGSTDINSTNKYKPYSCPKCEKTFANSSNRNKHVKTHSDVKPYSCPECGKGFTRTLNLQTHLQAHAGKKPFKCEYCGKGLTTAIGLKRHVQRHDGERPHRCGICGKGFVTAAHLQTHSLIHSGDRPHKCPICDKGFTQAGDMKVHLRIHTKEMSYKCSTCGKDFSSKGNLNKHEQLHSGEKAHSCPECHKCFAQSAHLQRHMIVHTGERMYKCDECDKSFAVPGELRIHKRKHTGYKPHQCDHCQKTFTQAAHLRRHQLTHNDKAGTDRCHVCNKSFTKKESLQAHIMLIHPNVVTTGS